MSLRAPQRHGGFTLIEVLIVVGIIGVLLGFLLGVLPFVKIRANNAATLVLIDDVERALIHYRSTHASYPLKPGSSTMLWDNGSSLYAPLFYQSDCAPLGAQASGVESNKDLIKLLNDTGCYKPPLSRMRNGELIDYFGTPLLFRFLVVQKGSGPDAVRQEPVYIWSYGHNRRNDTPAQPVFANLGLPVYDQAEADKLEAQPPQSADDLSSWRSAP